jgi:hypothetical protein
MSFNADSEIVPGWTSQEILDLVKFGIFDADYYLANNSDVAAVGADPLLHFLEFGWREGRRPSESVSESEMEFLTQQMANINNPMTIFKINHITDSLPSSNGE